MKVLLIPALRKTGGTGHLRRCVRLLSLLDPASRILCPAGPGLWTAGEIISRFAPGLDADRLAAGPEGRWDYILFDRRETTKKEFLELTAGRPSLGLDEGGEARPLFSFLVDTFPRLASGRPPNIQNEALIAEGPSSAFRVPETLKTALISFGGEDPCDLTGLTLKAFAASGLFSPADTGIVRGPAFSSPPPAGRGELYAGLEDIRPLFKKYDCVFTSFGITPYEVLRAGGIPLLVNPGGYHEKLSRKAGFYSLGVKKISAKKLRKIAARPGGALLKLGAKDFPETGFRGVLENFSPAGASLCPICGGGRRRPLLRSSEATFFRCACGMTYREGFSRGGVRYDRDYFFEGYRRQYGKTYLEDFGVIEGFARRRLSALSGLCAGLAGKTLLDIGCAYGPFLSAARSAGCLPLGIDIAQDAVRYVQDALRIPALCGDFPAMSEGVIAPAGKFDIITLWFVIEHFRAPACALSKISALLKKGGVLAFSTPNGRGVSGLFFSKKFLKNSPQDHYTIWNPRSCASILRRFGFRVRKIRVSGHHPERFPRPLRLFPGLRVCGLASRIFALGDTFEVYAEKIS